MSNIYNSLIHRFGYNYFFGMPVDSNVIYLLIGFYVIIIAAVFVYNGTLREKAKSEPPYSDFSKWVFWPNISAALAGLFLVFFRYERVSIFSWRVWQILLMAALIGYNLWVFIVQKKKLERDLVNFKQKARKEKWLPKGKKKRK